MHIQTQSLFLLPLLFFFTQFQAATHTNVWAQAHQPPNSMRVNWFHISILSAVCCILAVGFCLKNL